jgi:hypothetical protein
MPPDRNSLRNTLPRERMTGSTAQGALRISEEDERRSSSEARTTCVLESRVTTTSDPSLHCPTWGFPEGIREK